MYKKEKQQKSFLPFQIGVFKQIIYLKDIMTKNTTLYSNTQVQIWDGLQRTQTDLLTQGSPQKKNCKFYDILQILIST